MCVRKLAKRNARCALQGNWTRAAAIALLFVAIALLFTIFEALLTQTLHLPMFVDFANTPENLLDDLPNSSPASLAVASVTALLYLLVMTPLQLGVSDWYYRLGDGRVEEVSAVFEFFGSMRLFLKSIWLRVTVGIRTFLWLALFELAPVVVLVFAGVSYDAARSDSERLLSGGCALAGVAFAVVMGVVGILWCMRYALAPFAMLEDPADSPRHAVRRSIRASKGQRVALFELELSLIGWRLLGLLVATQLYTLPYIQTARGLYARYLLQMESRRFPKQPDLTQPQA